MQIPQAHKGRLAIDVVQSDRRSHASVVCRHLRTVTLLCWVTFATVACESEPATGTKESLATDFSLPTDETDADSMVCSQSDGLAAPSYADFEVSLPGYAATSGDYTPFRCLRFIDAVDVEAAGAEFQVVDIRKQSGHGDSRFDGLRIPLFEIKAKSFLRQRQVAILSDGRRYAALEKECDAIKAIGVRDVYAVLQPAMPVRRQGADIVAYRAMLPKDFVAERRFGVWTIVNLTSEESINEPVFQGSNMRPYAGGESPGSGAGAGLQRTLIVTDSGAEPHDAERADRYAGSGQVFVLQGGLQQLRQFRVESTAMALALAQPRISERGCSG